MLKQILICIIFLNSLSLLAQSNKSGALDQNVSIQFTNATVPAALRQLNRLTGLNYSSVTSIISRDVRINKSFINTSVRQIVEEILNDAKLNFREIKGTIIILKRVYSERKIEGRVMGSDSGEPLPFANVFIQNSTQGAPTDINGEFVIEDVPNTGFNLVISYLGYKPKTISFSNKQELEGRKFVVVLESDPIALESISVTTKAMKRKQFRSQKRLYERFEREFLGGSENAYKCKIINPSVLQFEVLDSLDNYSVTAKDILFVENTALGYRIAYLLEEFRFENGLKMNIGKARFTELQTKSRKRYSKWEVEREKAYYGSREHFLNALVEGNLEEEGFALNVVNYDSVTSEYTTPLNPPPPEEILSLEASGDEYLYHLKTSSDVEVTYKGEYEDSDYKKLYRSTSKSGNYKYTDKKVRSSISISDNASLSSYQVFGLDITDVELYQKSIIFFLSDKTTIGYPGQFLNPREVLIGGWWRWGAFSDWLPLNYRPN